MLVLSRQKDQTIMIGDLIEITVVEVRGDKVRLGINAPVSIPVHRKEVYQAIQRENQEAARATVEDISALQRSIGRPAEPPAHPVVGRLPADAAGVTVAASATRVVADSRRSARQ